MSDAIDYEISNGPDFAHLTVKLGAGEKIHAEPSAMAAMSGNIHLKAGLKGGIRRSIMRGLGGESLIINTFTAQEKPGEVVFAPGPMGDMHHYHLESGRTMLLQRGGYVANSPGIEVTSKWDGIRGFFSEGLFLLKCTGEGDLFFNTFGSLLPVDVSGEYFVDNNYIVAFEDTLDYEITTLPGLSTGGKIKSFFFGGEGLVCRFRGQGKLWVQTRCSPAFLNWVYPYRPTKNNNS